MSKIITEMAYSVDGEKPANSAFFRIDQPRHTIDWLKLPKEAKWAFSDAGGTVWWFSHKPLIRVSRLDWTFRRRDFATGNALFGIASGAKIFCDWKRSLVRRSK